MPERQIPHDYISNANHNRGLILLVFLLLAMTMSGCTGGGTTLPLPTDDLPTISVAVMKVDTGKFDGDLVERALDEYLAPLIGAHVSLQFKEHEIYDRNLGNFMTTDSRPDVFFIGRSASLAQLLENRQLLPLDTLLEEHGSAITPAVGEELLGAHVYGGMTYAIPTLTDRAACLSFIYRKNIADTYIPDIASVETIDDLTAVLMRLMRSNEDIVPVSAYSFRTWDPLSDELGVLMDYGQSKQVVNLYDSEAYRDICRTIREWQINGLLIDEDYGRTSVNNFVRTPEFFGRLRNYHPALIPVDSIDAGEPMDFIPIGETYTHTGFTKNFAWGISAETEHPVESMKFLNLLYSDPNVVNLLIYGVEGVHYEVIDTEMGIIDFPAGVTVETSGYAQFRQYQHGNQFISYIWNGYPTDIWEQVQTFNRKAVRSVAYGFSYDPAPVSEQVNACLQVVSEYTAPLEAGVGDTDLLLTEFRAALKEAGIDLVTAEKQRQLDAWLAAKQMQ